MPFFRLRLLQELASAQSPKEACEIYERARPEIENMEPDAAEQLREEAQDIIREKFS